MEHPRMCASTRTNSLRARCRAHFSVGRVALLTVVSLGLMLIRSAAQEREDDLRATLTRLRDYLEREGNMGDPVTASAYLGVLAQTKDTASLLGAHADVRAPNAQNPARLLAEVRILTEKGNYQRAYEALEVLSDMCPDNAQIAFQKGLHFLRIGREPAAAKFLELAIKLDPLLAAPHYWLAFHARGRADKVYHFGQVLLLEAPGSELAEKATRLLAQALLDK